MRKTLPAWLLLSLVGCSPLQVESRTRIALDTPVVTQNRVAVALAPVSEAGPVVPMGVAGPCAGGPRVAVLDVDGLLLDYNFTGPYSLGENPLALFRERLDAIAADASVRAVVLRINSPGGGVTTTDIMWRDLKAFRERTRLPVVACVMDVGTGGAYYLATAADLIVAHPTSVTGGVGVILNLYNLRDLMAQYNIVPQEVKSGKNVDMGTSARSLSPEARALFQSMADEFHERFRQVVLQARPGVRGQEATTLDGRVFTANQALQRGLIDRVGYVEDAVAAARELAGLPDAQVVLFHRPNDPARSLYAVTPNVPLQGTGWPVSLPGLDRSRLPAFLYMWQPEVTLERMGGR